MPRGAAASPDDAASLRCFSFAVVGSPGLGGSPPQPVTSASATDNESQVVVGDILEDHAIVQDVADDDRALMDRLAVLEAEVKADADAKQARQTAAAAKLREPRVVVEAPRRRPVTDEPRRRGALEDLDSLDNLGGALELAGKANRVKQELTRAPGKGDKSWKISALVSAGLGPIGWLYAGSMREAVPASAATLLFALVASKILPVFLMLPVLMVVMPLSAIAGVMYATQFNRSGKRQRLFDKSKTDAAKPKQLR